MPNLAFLPNEALELILNYICSQSINNDLSVPPALLALSSTCRLFRHKSIPFLALYLPFRNSSDWCCKNAEHLTSFQHPMPRIVNKKSKQTLAFTTHNPTELVQLSTKSTNRRKKYIKNRTYNSTHVSNPELETLLHLLKLPSPPPLHTIDLDLRNARLSGEIQTLIHRVAPTLKRFRLRCDSTSSVPQQIPFQKLRLNQTIFSLSLSGSNGWSTFIRSLRAVPPTCLRLFISGPLLGKFPSDLIKPLMKSVRRLELINDLHTCSRKENIHVKKTDSVHGSLNPYMNLLPLCDELEELCVDGFDITDENLFMLQDYKVLLKLHRIEMRRSSNKCVHQVLSTDLKRLISVIEVMEEEITPQLVKMLPNQLSGLAVAVDENSLRAVQYRISDLTKLKSLRLEVSKIPQNQNGIDLLVDTVHRTIGHLQELRITGCAVVNERLLRFISDNRRNLRVFALQIVPFIQQLNLANSFIGYLHMHRFQQLSFVQNMNINSASVTRYEECDNTSIGWLPDTRPL